MAGIASERTSHQRAKPVRQHHGVWIDANHDGISQPEELQTLEEIGIIAISLRYEPSPYTDQYGNQFRYRGRLVPVRGDHVDRKLFDVYLKTQ